MIKVGLIEIDAQNDLVLLCGFFRFAGRSRGGLKDRKSDSSQNPNNHDYNKYFNQRKSLPRPHKLFPPIFCSPPVALISLSIWPPEPFNFCSTSEVENGTQNVTATRLKSLHAIS